MRPVSTILADARAAQSRFIEAIGNAMKNHEAAMHAAALTTMTPERDRMRKNAHKVYDHVHDKMQRIRDEELSACMIELLERDSATVGDTGERI
jgi:hypothetical protein